MDKKTFWSWIEQAGTQQDNGNDPLQWLTESLAKESSDDILDFSIIFETLMAESYTSSLWGAAYVIMGGCSDDSFDYFRGWLIAQGQAVYEKAVKDPETLADAESIPLFYEEKGYHPELEDMLRVPFDAFLLKRTDQMEFDDVLYNVFLEEMEEKGHTHETPDIEFDWEDEDDLEEMFPRLWERFGENPLG